MTYLYVLDENKKPVPAKNHEEWSKFFQSKNRIIAKTEIHPNVEVSTVFLAIPHHGGMFETMIFNGPHDGYQERYETWEQGEEGHKVAVELAKEIKNGD